MTLLHQALLSEIKSDLKAFSDATSLKHPKQELCLELINSGENFEAAIELYEQIKFERNQIDIENLLIESAPLADFEALNLPIHTHPKPYQRLPRVRSGDGVRAIDRRFLNLPILKRLYVERAISHLYCDFALQPATIHILTFVIADGIGDYFAGSELRALIERELPEHQIIYSPSLVEGSSVVNEPHALFYPFGSLPPVPKVQADLQIEYPTIYPTLEKSDICMGEFGFIRSEHFNPLASGYCTGLHFLEKGMLFKEMPLEKQGDFFLCYARTQTSLNRYLETLKRNFSAPINLLFGGFNYKIHDPYFNVTYFDSIAPDQFRRLIAQSREPLLCRGDQSMTEAISANKLFFADLPDHREPFFRDLLDLTQARAPETVKYFQSMNGDKPPQRLSKEVKSALYKLNSILRQEYTLAPYFTALIKRHLAYKQYPGLKRAESALIDQFSLGKITFKTLILDLKQILDIKNFNTI
ncbi:MAG: hypothetical protein MRY21_06110 [Simkaniaceae bacterium]|nr:hypothetical protein [Simkaniaceae bacterium]